MNEPENIRPLREVWLRPRRVFRALALQPVGVTDYALAAALCTCNFLALRRTESAGAHDSVGAILGSSLAYGVIGGFASLWMMGWIYSRVSTRAGGRGSLAQVIHVLAYGNVPVAASLGLWLLVALAAGPAAFLENPPGPLELIPALLLHAQVPIYVFLLIWSVVLQAMGFSEIQGFTVGKALVVWLLGQLIAGLVWLLFMIILDLLFSGGLLHLAPDR